ncbi:hypothetical protein C8Q77DRAFT_1211815 [Trametes polyzona]|nr:hypothetical protein C8Q77DRAFT_1211815 [Trametes polyzona]
MWGWVAAGGFTKWVRRRRGNVTSTTAFIASARPTLSPPTVTTGRASSIISDDGARSGRTIVVRSRGLSSRCSRVRQPPHCARIARAGASHIPLVTGVRQWPEWPVCLKRPASRRRRISRLLCASSRRCASSPRASRSPRYGVDAASPTMSGESAFGSWRRPFRGPRDKYPLS